MWGSQLDRNAVYCHGSSKTDTESPSSELPWDLWSVEAWAWMILLYEGITSETEFLITEECFPNPDPWFTRSVKFNNSMKRNSMFKMFG